MGPGLLKTFDLLATTPNEAAVNVLLAALDSPRAEIRRAALRALVVRRSPLGHREMLRRAARMDEILRDVVGDGIGFMEPTLRESLWDGSRQACFGACQIVLWSREYDLFPALLGLSPDGGVASSLPFDDLRRKTALQLTELLYDELHGPRRPARRRDPWACRGHAVACLEKSMRQADPASGPGLVEAYLTLSQRDDASLRQVLHEPHDPQRDLVLANLGQSRRPAVMRLLASFIDDPHAPLAALRLIAARSDPEFVRQLVARLGDTPSAVAAGNLHRLESLAWASPARAALAALDGNDQRRALSAILATSLTQEAKFQALECVAHHGQPAGRCAALNLLEEFQGTKATELLLYCAADDDPQVQAAAVMQLRPCNVPGAIPLLINRLQSPHPVVRQAVRDSLSEFRFDRFVTSYEALEHEARRTTGELVKQIDPAALDKLRAELSSPSRLRRLRALELIDAMNAVVELESELIASLDDADYLVRAESLRVLTNCGATTHGTALMRRPYDEESPFAPLPAAPMAPAASAGGSALPARDDFTQVERFRKSGGGSR